MMIFGTTIAPGQTVRTQTFMRQADNAVFRYEAFGGQGDDNGTTVKVYHKNREDTAWAEAGEFSTGTELEIEGLEEELTMQFAMGEVDHTIEDPLPNVVRTNNTRVRALPTQWYNDPTYVAP